MRRHLGLLILAVVLALACAAPARSAFPGDNGLIAFQKRAGDRYQIFTTGADGKDTTKIPSAGHAFAPAFAPDGRRLAVFRELGSQSGVWVFDLDSGTWAGRVAALPGDLMDSTAPAWSPDGQKIVYTLDQELHIVDADGTNAHPVLAEEDSLVAYEPSWSPNGGQIAFRGCTPISPTDCIFNIYTVTPAGTGLTKLTSAVTSDPNWSPDGSRIAYTRAGPSNSDIWVMDADGENQTPVTSTGGRTNREMHPAWSPQGDRIAFFDQQAGWLSTINPDGTGRKELRKMPQGAGAPDWQPEARAPLSVTLNYSTPESVVRANGQVDPPHPGSVMDVDLAVKRGKWVTVASKRPTLSADSRYVVQFPRRSEALCQLTTSFPGDADHRPTSISKIFSC